MKVWCFNSSDHERLVHSLTPLFWLIADAQHLREVMDKQASLEQRLELKDKEIEDLKKKLVGLDEQKSCV
jgi:hypothetical protein